MTRFMRYRAAASLLLSLFPGSAVQDIRPVLGAHAAVQAIPVALAPGDPGVRAVGRLAYLGGVRLTSPDPAFGGFSAMLVEGDRFTLLNDAGGGLRFRLGPGWEVREPRFFDLPGGPGIGFTKDERDSESMARDPATGRIWVAFEVENAIWRFDPALRRAEAQAMQAAMADWPSGGGPEAMMRQRDGRFVVLSETGRPAGMRHLRKAVRFAGDPAEPQRAPPVRFFYQPPAGFNPTDIAELPDGRSLVLNRRFGVPALFTAVVTLVDMRRVRSGSVVQGVEVARFEPPLLHDNFEALAVTQEGGDTIVWIASDDNGEWWEQSLLLKFRLELPPAPDTRKARPRRQERATR